MMAAAARPGLLYILNKPLLRDAVAQRALQHWYTNTHIRDLLSINSTSNGIKRVYAYQSVDPDINGPGGFLALCPIADSSVLRTDTVGNVLSFERTILPLLSKSVTIQTSKLFTLPHRPIAMKELEKDPREGGAHLRELESEKSLVHEPKSNFVEIPPEPGLNEMLNPYENFLCPNEPFDLDRADYRNYPDFDPDQDFWCVLEPPSESSEQHYMDTKPALYDGSIPPEGLPLQSAIKIEPRLYDRIMTSDDKKWATNQLALAPYLLLTHIPFRENLTPAQNEAAFARNFKRYPYLTETDEHRRHAGYKQDDAAHHARWLLVQELNDLSGEAYDGWYELKKQEAKAWWKRQGYEGVKLDFYTLVAEFGGDGGDQGL